MISFEEALEIIYATQIETTTETIDFRESLGRVLSQDVYSDINMPPFDKSAVDGYACRKADLDDYLKVMEVIAAGKTPEFRIKKATCSKIMTGAMVPDGADTIIMVEDVEKLPDGKIRYLKKAEKTNICILGEDIRTGDIALSAPLLIKPQHIAIMATVGHTRVSVYRTPKVGVIPTGNEIVEPENKPKPAEIRNSNGIQLISQLQNIGIQADYTGIARDTEASTLEKIEQSIAKNDIILMSGGVSKGDFDLVPKIISDFGFHTLFHNVSVQPGKPTLFAQKGNKFLFGLPGNPVSAFTQFILMVQPFIYRFMGLEIMLKRLILPLGADYKRKKAKRMSWIPVQISPAGEIFPLNYHGSAHVNALANADGLIAIPSGIKYLKKSSQISVRLI